MTSDDPKFTAHVLGECEDLTAAERAEIEALIASDPATAAEAVEMRALAARLRAELAAEAAAGLKEGQRAAVLKAATSAVTAGKVVPFPRRTAALAAMAASLVVGVTAALVYREMRETPGGNLPIATRILSENPVAIAASNISRSKATRSFGGRVCPGATGRVWKHHAGGIRLRSRSQNFDGNDSSVAASMRCAQLQHFQ